MQNTVEMGELVILQGEPLLVLAKTVYNKEMGAITNIKFHSEFERAKYLRDCRANYQSILDLLAAGDDLERRFHDIEAKAKIARDVYYYLVYSVNTALQVVRNYTIRIDYADKVKKHTNTVLKVLQELDVDNIVKVASFAKEAAQYRNAMWEYTKKHRSFASTNFSKWLKKSGIKFGDLIKRYQSKLGFGGPFKDLEVGKKLQVYEEIIEASGRGRVIKSKLSMDFGGIVGIAVLLFNASLMAWDIFTSDHMFETATRNIVVAAAAAGGAKLGEVLGTTALSSVLVGTKASGLFVLMMGTIGSILGAFIFGAFAGWLVGLIFGSGGDDIPLSTDGLRFYVAPLPDGQALARQIRHCFNLEE